MKVKELKINPLQIVDPRFPELPEFLKHQDPPRSFRNGTPNPFYGEDGKSTGQDTKDSETDEVPTINYLVVCYEFEAKSITSATRNTNFKGNRRNSPIPGQTYFNKFQEELGLIIIEIDNQPRAAATLIQKIQAESQIPIIGISSNYPDGQNYILLQRPYSREKLLETMQKAVGQKQTL